MSLYRDNQIMNVNENRSDNKDETGVEDEDDYGDGSDEDGSDAEYSDDFEDDETESKEGIPIATSKKETTQGPAPIDREPGKDLTSSNQLVVNNDSRNNADQREQHSSTQTLQDTVPLSSGADQATGAELGTSAELETAEMEEQNVHEMPTLEEEAVENTEPHFRKMSLFREPRHRQEISRPGKNCKLSIDQCDLVGKRVLMRVDYNVPVQNGVITNTQKIEATIPTIQLALSRGAKCVTIISHCCRPDGQVIPELSLRPVAKEVERLLEKPVMFLTDCVGPEVERACSNPQPGSVILLENLRFHIEEEGQGVGVHGRKMKAKPEEIKEFRDSLSKLGDLYVNDAFSTAHRAHSSVVGVALPQRAAGLLMKKEMEIFNNVLDNPTRPFLAIVGGSKVTDKVLLIRNLLDIVDEMIIAGGMAFTFLKVLYEMQIGDSLWDSDEASTVHSLVEQAKKNGVCIHLPVDVIAADKFAEDARSEKYDLEEGIPDGMIGLDVGEKTNQLFSDVIMRAKTIVWTGPPGVYEWEEFSGGTRAMLDAVVMATTSGATTVLAGGDTATCAKKYDAVHKVTHVSTGGGASIEFLEGKSLPGIVALSKPPRKEGELDKRSIDQCPLKGHRVIIRADFNVPISQGKIIDNHKLVAALPTIEFAMKKGAKAVILLSHLGYPDGYPDVENSLTPVVKELEKLLRRKIIFLDDCVGEDVEEACMNPKPGSVIMLENVRFYVEEEGKITLPDGSKVEATAKEITVFRNKLSRLGDVFINDDFSTSHREHSSIVGINAKVKACGMLMKKDLEFFAKALEHPRRPFLVILGGSTLADKISLIDSLLDLADEIILAGGLAFTFLKVLNGMDSGESLIDNSGADVVQNIVDRAANRGVKLHFPVDFITENNSDGKREIDTEGESSSLSGVLDGMMALDIGEKSRIKFAAVISRASTIIWTGLPGVCDKDRFSGGSKAMMDAVVEASENGAMSIIVGGDTAAFCRMHNVENKVSHMTTGGGACQELLEGKMLPGVAFLDPNPGPRNVRVNVTDDISEPQEATKSEQEKKTLKRERKEKEKKKKEQGKEKEKKDKEKEKKDKEKENGQRLEHEKKTSQKQRYEIKWKPATQDSRYTAQRKWSPPCKRKLPPLPTYQKPKPPIKYTGAPPPGTSIPPPVGIFRPKPWTPPPPPPPPPKKPRVPRLSGRVVPLPPIQQPSLKPEVPYKFGEVGRPGPEHSLPRLPHIQSHFDQLVTLVQGYTTTLETFKADYSHKHNLVPFSEELCPSRQPDMMPYRGRHPKLNTTMAHSNNSYLKRIYQ